MVLASTEVALVDSISNENSITLTTQLPIYEPDTLFMSQKEIDRLFWKPDPMRSVWLGAIVPGLGQIYNRSYWKLPIVYG